MSNPYQQPTMPEGNPAAADNSIVSGPAIGLIVVSIISIALCSLGLLGDLFLIVSGAAAQVRNRGFIPQQTVLTIRILWGIVLIAASSYVLYGALAMKGLKNFATARLAAIIACIPLIGPCCILGIPFGIWALVTLRKPGVEDLFASQEKI